VIFIVDLNQLFKSIYLNHVNPDDLFM